MRIFWGAVVLVTGIAGLALWGANTHAERMEAEVRLAAEPIVEGTLHPMSVTVSGRDIEVTGTADSDAELAGVLTALDQVEGRRVVRSDKVEILRTASPYETAIAKGIDGTLGLTGTVPTRAAGEALEAAGLTGAASLPLASGAPDGWQAALTTGAEALAPLEEGSFALTGQTAILNGVARTGDEADLARIALSDLSDVAGRLETVVNIEVLDPGVVSFELRFDPVGGLTLSGSIPEGLGADGIARALSLPAPSGEFSPTAARMPDLEDQLAALRPALSELNGLILRVENGAITGVTARLMPGLDIALVGSMISEALGGRQVNFTDAAISAQDGDTRSNLVTGATEVANNGYWLAQPDFPISGATCNAQATALQDGRRIQFVTGSAELDKRSLALINDVAGLVLYCTQPFGMNVVIGGHTDSDGDEDANFALSVARANAVRNALAARGVPPKKMIAIGHGETEPIAPNDTEEGRAMNRRTTFNWPE